MAFIQGDNGPNVLTGTAGADTIQALNGNDTITGGGGNDNIDAGFGIDTVNLSGIKAQYQFTMMVDANTWQPTANFESHYTLNTFDLVGGRDGDDSVGDLEFLHFADGTARWYDVPVSYTVKPVAADQFGGYVAGGTMNDTMTGSAGDEIFVGGLGNDVMDGLGGYDTVNYETFNTYVTVESVPGGMSINLQSGQASGAWGTDTILNMEAAVGTNYDDFITGNEARNLLVGNGGNDTIRGGDGDDTLYGGDGLDWALFTGQESDHLIVFSFFGDRAVNDTVAGGGVDELTGIERLLFDDYGRAFDFTGHAGTSARLIGVLLGAEFVRNPVVEGIVMQALDSGMTADALATLAIGVLYPTYTPQQLADLIYFNVLHTHPSPDVVNYLVDVMAITSPSFLAVYASTLAENDQSIGFVDLVGTGVPFSAPV